MTPPTWLYWPATGGGGTPWAPTDLTGLQCWLDASDSSTITESSGSISLWEDKTANDYDADDAVNTSNVKITTKRPTVATAAQNGLDAIAFNGSQWFDHNTAKGMLKNRSHALLAVVMKWGAVNTNNIRVVWANSNQNAGTALRLQWLHSNTNAFSINSRRLDADTTSAIVSTSADPPYNTNWQVHIVSCDWGTGDLEYWVDGTQFGGTQSYPGTPGNTSNTDLGSVATTRTAIGALDRSSSGSANAPSGTRIGEMICGALSSGSYATSDREKLEGYLAWKWGLEGNLPNGHPYKNAAP